MTCWLYQDFPFHRKSMDGPVNKPDAGSESVMEKIAGRASNFYRIPKCNLIVKQCGYGHFFCIKTGKLNLLHFRAYNRQGTFHFCGLFFASNIKMIDFIVFSILFWISNNLARDRIIRRADSDTGHMNIRTMIMKLNMICWQI